MLKDWLYDVIWMNPAFHHKIIITIVVGLLLYSLRRLVGHFFLQKDKDVKKVYYWSKWATYTNYILFMLIITPVWITELQSAGTFLGLLTAGLAVALKEPISNFFAWIYIVIKKPFEMGDRIQIGDSEGDILDIGFFEFTLLEIKNWVKADQSTGRIIHIPNGLLFTKPVVNYNQAMNYIWNEIPIMITFESDWKKAKKLLLEIEVDLLNPLMEDATDEFAKAKRSYNISYRILTPTVYVRIEKNGVLLTLRYLCNPKKRRATEQIAFEAILEFFYKEKDIQFAYDTVRFYQEGTERELKVEN
ncbi:MAG: mechanosensitive ion channel family protein [Saprospiraceae bacterium]